MTMQLNGHRPGVMPAPVLQFNFSGQLVPVIAAETDPTLSALDCYDDAIAMLDAALADRDAAAALYDEADRKSRISAERCRLARLSVQARIADGDGRAAR